MASLALVAMADDTPSGLLDNPRFTRADALSSSSQLMRRLVTPLNAQRLSQEATRTGQAIVDQPVDPAREHFALYVPHDAPPDGYALLVFVPPWNDATIPHAWMPVLERHGMILATAAGIGNDTSLLDRRDPVALLAATNVMARYRVNPNRVYVGGFSGGSRVALRLALGYPDLFHGALLEAGSDAIGEQIAPPPRELMALFQASTRVVYLTGQADVARADRDRLSRHSLRQWCVDDVDTRAVPQAGHELADATSLDRALGSLEQHHAHDPSALAACQARIDDDMRKALDAVAAALNAGQRDVARQRLDAVDQRYGGLAAPRSTQLMTPLGK